VEKDVLKPVDIGLRAFLAPPKLRFPNYLEFAPSAPAVQVFILTMRAFYRSLLIIEIR
jgi:hypothetical protein